MIQQGSRSLARTAVLAGVFACVSGAQGVVVVQGDASARLVRGGSVTFGESETGVVPLPNDGTTGVAQITNTHLFASAEGVSHLTGAAMGAGASALGASNLPADGLLYQAAGFGNSRYQDELTVTSATLATGTPVVVQFSFHLAHAIDATSSVLDGGNTLHGRASASMTATMTSSDFASGTIDSQTLADADNNAVIDTGFSINSAKGLFGGGHHVDVLLNATIGATIQFSLILDTDAVIDVAPAFGVNQTASGAVSMGIAFGATGLAPARAVGEVRVMSARLGGEFPDASMADATHAMVAMPMVPAPAGSAGLALGIAVGAGSRRRGGRTFAVGHAQPREIMGG